MLLEEFYIDGILFDTSSFTQTSSLSSLTGQHNVPIPGAVEFVRELGTMVESYPGVRFLTSNNTIRQPGYDLGFIHDDGLYNLTGRDRGRPLVNPQVTVNN